MSFLQKEKLKRNKIISFSTIHKDEKRAIKVELDDIDYKLAYDAHKDNKKVAIEGILDMKKVVKLNVQ